MATILETLETAVEHHRAGRFQAAEQIYRDILQADPNQIDALHLLGLIAHQVGRHEVAVDHIRRAVALAPEKASFHNNLAAACRALGRLDEAVAGCRRALEIRPHYAQAHNNLGNALKDQGKLDQAVAAYRRAVEIKPDYAEAHNNLGQALQEQGYRDDAAAAYRQALQDNPAYAEAHHNLGTLFQEESRLEEALESYRQALQIKPDYADAHFNRALIRLCRSDLENGWPEYEWRLRREPCPQQPAGPAWDGSSLAGKRILVHGEQGIGDEIMFASCLPEVVRRAAGCTVRCDPRLVSLFARSFASAEILRNSSHGPHASPTSLPHADVRIAIGSLPRFFRTTLDSVPQTSAYLAPDPTLLGKWRSRFAKLGDGLKVGISWRGGNTPAIRKKRSTSLNEWAPLFATRRLHFVNLQYGDCRAELAAAEERLAVKIHDWEDADPLTDLDDFAAQIAALDLVISVDNSTVHMAGALDVPVWILLSRPADWRWMLHREDSPWYAAARLFRNTSADNWAPIFERVADELATFACQGRALGVAPHSPD